jgi:hypothetical protein
MTLTPTMTCTVCRRTRACVRHLRADHPPTAAQAWLRRQCPHRTNHPCVFQYQAGLSLPLPLQKGFSMTEMTWQTYRRTTTAEMRPYVPGEDLTSISVSATDTPEVGGMIARNPTNHADQWYVAPQYFLDNFEQA